MKLPHAFQLLALALCLGTSLQAAAIGPLPESQPQQRTVGEILAGMQGTFDQACQKARTAFQAAAPADKDSAAMTQVLQCDCIPKAIATAFPADSRAARMSGGEVVARVDAASDVCSAATIHRRIELACERGLDPFAKKDERTPAARTQARCRCATSKLAELAGADPRQAANDAAADYAAVIAKNPDATPGPSQRQQQQLQDIQQTCSALGEPAQ